MKLTHGGDWAGFRQEYGAMPLDFSANISPLGLPEGVRRTVVASLDGAARNSRIISGSLRDISCAGTERQI